MQRVIPSSGELLPAIGLGTWIQFDVGSGDKELATLKETLRQMHGHGGKLIDSSPMYGNAEHVVGDLTNEIGLADQFFYATKVWTTGKRAGIEQMETSLKKMRSKTMDLMQVHNLVDWKTHLDTLKDWKQQNKVRYTGVTHYTVASHAQLEQVIKTAKVDFVQFNYSIGIRNAEKTLLKTAMDNGVAVIVNEPFDKGSLFKKVNGKPLPTWTEDYNIHSWTQYFIKYIISHPAVTCVIPGTSDPAHIADNMLSGYGVMPDEKGRKKMADFIDDL